MQNFIVPLIYVIAFIAVVMGVQAVANLFFAERAKTQRVNRRLTLLDSGMSHEEVYASLVRDNLGGKTGLAGFEARIARAIQQADMSVSARRLIIMVAVAALAAWGLSLLALRMGGGASIVNAIVTLLAAAGLASAFAWMFIGRRRAKRMKALEDQLPLALDIMIRALRAGHPVISAVQLSAEECGDPIGTEFGLIVDETTYGLEFREALFNFARRTGSRDAAFFAISVSIQSQTGGNLAEILAGLATVIRGRLTLAKRIQALSSEAKASAALLSVLPGFLIGFMLLTQPSFYTSKFADPIFWPIVIGIFLTYLAGLLMLRRIVNFKY